MKLWQRSGARTPSELTSQKNDETKPLQKSGVMRRLPSRRPSPMNDAMRFSPTNGAMTPSQRSDVKIQLWRRNGGKRLSPMNDERRPLQKSDVKILLWRKPSPRNGERTSWRTSGGKTS